MYIIYDNKGNIIRFTSSDYLSEDEYLIEYGEILDDSAYYVNTITQEVSSKQDYTLENLPLPCTITIEGVSYEVTEQPTFEFDVAGEYIIEVDAGVEYLKKEFKYVVEA